MNERKPGARAVGFAVEEAVCKQVEALGYKIIERNYSCRFGEVDIVAQEGRTLVFIEVRYRGHGAFESPAESLNQRKLNRIMHTAMDYLYRRRIEEATPVRVDACLCRPVCSGDALLDQRFLISVPALGLVRFEIIRGIIDLA